MLCTAAKLHEASKGWIAAAPDLLEPAQAAAYLGVVSVGLADWQGWIEPTADLIAAQFDDTDLLAAEFRRHGFAEGIGARTIRHVALSCATGDLLDQMLAHADDEARHARMFAALASHVVSGVIDDFSEMAAENQAFLEAFGGDLHWFLGDAHIAELRNLVVLGAYVNAARAQPNQELHVIRVLERIFEDEWRHVSYTAPIVADLLIASEENRVEFAQTMAHYGRVATEEAVALSARLSKSERIEA